MKWGIPGKWPREISGVKRRRGTVAVKMGKRGYQWIFSGRINEIPEKFNEIFQNMQFEFFVPLIMVHYTDPSDFWNNFPPRVRVLETYRDHHCDKECQEKNFLGGDLKKKIVEMHRALITKIKPFKIKPSWALRITYLALPPDPNTWPKHLTLTPNPNT